MKIAICAKAEDFKKLRKLTVDYCAECNCYPVIDMFQNRERIIEAMIKNSYHIVIVAIDKAKGMETVKHIHLRDGNAKIIWFSDDEDFAGFAFQNEVYGYSHTDGRTASRLKSIKKNSDINKSYWLRTAEKSNSSNACSVDSDARMYNGSILANSVDNSDNGVSPALNLKLSSAIFTSAAEGSDSQESH